MCKLDAAENSYKLASVLLSLARGWVTVSVNCAKYTLCESPALLDGCAALTADDEQQSCRSSQRKQFEDGAAGLGPRKVISRDGTRPRTLYPRPRWPKRQPPFRHSSSLTGQPALYPGKEEEPRKPPLHPPPSHSQVAVSPRSFVRLFTLSLPDLCSEPPSASSSTVSTTTGVATANQRLPRILKHPVARSPRHLSRRQSPPALRFSDGPRLEYCQHNTQKPDAVPSTHRAIDPEPIVTAATSLDSRTLKPAQAAVC